MLIVGRSWRRHANQVFVPNQMSAYCPNLGASCHEIRRLGARRSNPYLHHLIREEQFWLPQCP